MKILHIQPQGEIGGAERITLDWIRHTEVQNVALVGGSGRLSGMLEQQGCRVYSVRPWRPRNVWSLLPAVAAIVEREEIDLLASSNWDGHLLGGLLRLRTRRPEIWFNHGPIERVAWSRFSRFIPADALLVASRYIEHEQRRQGYWAKRLFVHRYGVDCRAFTVDAAVRRTVRSRLGITDEICIAMVARFEPGKGQTLLLAALSGIKRRRPDLRFKVVFVGGMLRLAEAHAYEQKVKQMVHALGLAPVTFFSGHVENVTDYFNAADLHVVASIVPESFGLSLLEGMAMQKVTLAPREGGPGEIVTHGEDGYLFAPRDPKALSSLLETVMDDFGRDPDRLMALRQAARRKVETHYDIVESARKLEEIYRWIVKGRSTRRSKAREARGVRG